MSIWNKRRSVDPPAALKPVRPASRQQVDGIRRKAQRYTEITEQSGNQSIDQIRAHRQRERAEKEMATLRAEAVQARRLATQIENLHQSAPIQRKGRIMNTTIADPGQVQRMKRRETDAPPTTGGQLSFNPLHPSMELPPEHLIRLLGLENKTKRRRKQPRPASAASAGNASSHSKPANKPVKLSLPETPPASAERERDSVPTPFGEPRRLLVPSVIAGTAAGVIISAYLFLAGPEHVVQPVIQEDPATSQATPPRPNTPPRTAPAMAPAAASVPAPAPVARPATVPVAAAHPAETKPLNAVPQADMVIREEQLRREAGQRFSERMTVYESAREREALQQQAEPEQPAATEEEAVDRFAPPPPVTLDDADTTLPPQEATEETTVDAPVAGAPVAVAPAPEEAVTEEAVTEALF